MVSGRDGLASYNHSQVSVYHLWRGQWTFPLTMSPRASQCMYFIRISEFINYVKLSMIIFIILFHRFLFSLWHLQGPSIARPLKSQMFYLPRTEIPDFQKSILTSMQVYFFNLFLKFSFLKFLLVNLLLSNQWSSNIFPLNRRMPHE